MLLGFYINSGEQRVQHGNKLILALVRFAVEVDEDDIYQATVWIWFYIVMALIDDMRVQGIGDDGVFLVRRAIHTNPDAVDLLHIVVLFFV